MAVTFTNRAAAEMWERVVTLFSGGEELVPLRVGTFHRLALDLLARIRARPVGHHRR